MVHIGLQAKTSSAIVLLLFLWACGGVEPPALQPREQTITTLPPEGAQTPEQPVESEYGADAVRLRVSYEYSWLKANTEQSGDLPDNQKCYVEKDDIVILKGPRQEAAGDHAQYEEVLAVLKGDKKFGCKVSPVVVYEPHYGEGPSTIGDTSPKPDTELDLQQLGSRINDILTQANDSDTRWSVMIQAYGPRSQKIEIFKLEADQVVRPASTMKLFTTWAYMVKNPDIQQMQSGEFYDLRAMVKDSLNDEAKAYLADVGGAAAVVDLLREKGLTLSSGFHIADGSGESYDNQVSAQDLVALIDYVRRQSYIKAFRATLPVAGVDGTLASRLGNVAGTVAAKTGTLIRNPASALAGIADAQNGWQVVFAFLGDSLRSIDEGVTSIDSAVGEILRAINEL